MPEYLTLNGVVIPCQEGGETEPSVYGETVRMYDNSIRSTEEPDFRTRRWQFRTGPLKGAEWDVIAPILRNTSVLSAAGYAIDRTGAAVSVLCVLGEVPNEEDGDADVGYVASFTLYERLSVLTTNPSSLFYLTGVANGADLLLRLGSPEPGEGGLGVSGGTVSACGAGDPCVGAPCAATLTVLDTWRSLAVADNTLDGTATLAASAIGINPWGTWWRMSLTATLRIERAGVVVEGPFAFTAQGVDFSGGGILLQTVSALNAVEVLTGDEVVLDVISIMGMNACRADDGFRPSFFYGGAGAVLNLPAVNPILPGP